MNMFGDKLGLVYTDRKHEMRKPKIFKVFIVSHVMSTTLFRNKINGDLGDMAIAFAFTLPQCEQAFVISWGAVFCADRPSGRNLRCCQRRSPLGPAASSRGAVEPWRARLPAAPGSPLAPSPKLMNQNSIKTYSQSVKYILKNKLHLSLLRSSRHCSL